MKCLLTTTLFFFVASIGLYSQSEGCITQQDEQLFERLEYNLKQANKTVEKGYVTRFVPVHFHIVTDNDGSNSLDEDKLIKDLCKLNNRYEEADILFYIDEISYINSTNLNSRPRLSSSVSLMRQNRNSNAMNVYLVTDILQNDGSPSGAAGYYSGGSNNDFIVMLKTTLGNDSFVLEHEIGHFFSLPHTHVGWEGDISQGSTNGGYQPDIHGDTVRIQIITGSTQSGPVEVELVNGSNCNVAGDRICDTPPDYGFGQSCGCCTMVYDVWDRNGDKIEPMIDNVMSYSNGCDPFLFSQEQIITMQSDFDSPFRSYLRTGEVTEYNPIPNSVNIISPVSDQIYEDFNGVLIEWEPIAEAEGYRVQISGRQQLSFITTDSELFLTELLPNSLYFVDVFAVNKFGTGCNTVTRRLFQTGTGSTSVNETESVNSVTLYPNPARSGEQITLRLEASKNISGQLSLYNLNGEKIWDQWVSIFENRSAIELSSAELTPGIYLLEFNSSEGLIVEKLIIE